jgi:hypothetical protein
MECKGRNSGHLVLSHQMWEVCWRKNNLNQSNDWSSRNFTARPFSLVQSFKQNKTLQQGNPGWWYAPVWFQLYPINVIKISICQNWDPMSFQVWVQASHFWVLCTGFVSSTGKFSHDHVRCKGGFPGGIHNFRHQQDQSTVGILDFQVL